MANTTAFDKLQPINPTSSTVSRPDITTEDTTYIFDPTTTLKTFLLTGGTSTGDDIAINGVSSSFKVSVKNNVMTIKGLKGSESAGVIVKMYMKTEGGSNTLWFADGSVDVTFTPKETGKGGIWTVGGLTVKSGLNMHKNSSYEINTAENFAAAEAASIPGQTLEMKTQIEALTGTSKGDLFTGHISGGLAYLVPDDTSTFQAGDINNGGEGIDTMALTVANAVYSWIDDKIVELNSIENVSIRNLSDQAIIDLSMMGEDTAVINAQLWHDVQKISSDNSVNAVVVRNVQHKVDIGMKNTDASLTVAYDGEKLHTGEIQHIILDDAGSDSAVTLDVENGGNQITSVTVDATGVNDIHFGSDLDHDGIVDLTVTGTGSVVFEDFFGSIETADFSGNSGGITFYAGNQIKTLAGSSGDDDVTLHDSESSGFTYEINVNLDEGDDRLELDLDNYDIIDDAGVKDGSTINGGAGSDTLAVYSSDAIQLGDASAADYAKKGITGFEVLELTSVFDGTLDMTNFDVSRVVLDYSADEEGNTIENLHNNSTISLVDYAWDGAMELTAAIADARTNVSDTLNIEFNYDHADHEDTEPDFGRLYVESIETLNLKSMTSSEDLDNISDWSNEIDVYSTDLRTINVSGDVYMRLYAEAYDNDLVAIDASTNTAGINVFANTSYSISITGTGEDDRIYGGSADDVINASGGDDYIDGNDGVDTITLGAGKDTVSLYYVTSSNNRDVIKGFSAGTDSATSDFIELADSDASIDLNDGVLDSDYMLSIGGGAAIWNSNPVSTYSFYEIAILELNFDMGSNADLGKVGATDGTELLNGLNGDGGSATLNMEGSGAGWIVAYDGGNAYLYYANSGDSTFDSNEIKLVATLENLAVGSLTADNFAFW